MFRTIPSHQNYEASSHLYLNTILYLEGSPYTLAAHSSILLFQMRASQIPAKIKIKTKPSHFIITDDFIKELSDT